MTPSARISAAIDILDRILNGEAAQKVLAGWARQNRYAGSGDRAHIRDLVFDILRRRRSCAAAGGAKSGRGQVLGFVRLSDQNPDTLFTGERFAPPPLSPEERAHDQARETWPDAVRLDYPDWLEPMLHASLGERFETILRGLQNRAPVYVRVNRKKADRTTAISVLAQGGITAEAHPKVSSALEVTENARKISSSRAFREGMIELQDAASQAVVNELELPQKGRILDYCAGGGGKALALADGTQAEIYAHDISARRMQNIAPRAARAGVDIACLAPGHAADHAPYDLVFCDAPCSGSGAWRRAPWGKWDLTAEKLAELLEIQSEILRNAAQLVAPGGSLAYATCSLFTEENREQVQTFLRENKGFTLVQSREYLSLDQGDGMYIAQMSHR